MAEAANGEDNPNAPNPSYKVYGSNAPILNGHKIQNFSSLLSNREEEEQGELKREGIVIILVLLDIRMSNESTAFQSMYTSKKSPKAGAGSKQPRTTTSVVTYRRMLTFGDLSSYGNTLVILQKTLADQHHLFRANTTM